MQLHSFCWWFRGILELLIQDPEGSNFKLYTCFGLWPEHVGFVFALKWQNPLSLPPPPWFCSVHLLTLHLPVLLIFKPITPKSSKPSELQAGKLTNVRPPFLTCFWFFLCFIFLKLSLNQSQFLASCCTNGLVCISAVQMQRGDRCYWQFLFHLSFVFINFI